MLQQTVARLTPLVPPQRIWTVTNADHYMAQPERYREIGRAALDEARKPGRMVVLGIPPTRPETGFGYIERQGESITAKGAPIFAVRCFKEKPQLAVAKEYLASANFHWNAGMFFWRVSTFLDALKEFLPKTHTLIEELAHHIGKRSYAAKLKRIYPQLENISVDYAILERATQHSGSRRVFVIPAGMGWSDIGSWAAVHELLAKHSAENIFAGPGHTLDAEGNFLWSPGKYVVAIAVSGLVVVQTPDALLISPPPSAPA